MRKTAFLLATSLAMIITLPIASGQGAMLEEPAKAYKTYDDCAAIAKESLRLKCFDLVHKGGVFTQEDGVKVVREEFGRKRVDLSAEKEEKHQITSNNKTKDLKVSEDKIEVKIVKIVKDLNKRSTFTLEDGQVWKQQSGSQIRVKAPVAAAIKRGALSSYNLIIDGTKDIIKVSRIR